ncbi:hypothetical protein TI39_contig513g00001 [Zymoseptoria brevis]|uniref:RRM domain-containing protein n=1 Tax=Zymoseptoria brevis TaxID=1047168 RepID=A0A0F4GJ40_9PEZI|nr:hypothetical protein TI39_contig513g00001 [Zymoseptoria brevis]
MSGEDDTFDIDIYGDDAEDTKPTETTEDYGEDKIDFGEDEPLDSEIANANAAPSHTQAGAVNTTEQSDIKQESQPPPAQQGTKRRAPDEDEDVTPARPASSTPMQQQQQQSHTSPSADRNATAALILAELNWWTTEEHLRAFCASAGVEGNLKELTFGEHKINGKSRGEAFLEFDSPSASAAVKQAIEKSTLKEDGTKKPKSAQVMYTPPGNNPFKGKDSGAVSKKEYTSTPGGRGGAYNSFGAGRGGGFQRGGGGGFQRGGGGFQNRGGYQGGMAPQAQQGGGYGMNGGMNGGMNPAMGMNPGFANPMMAMGMGGFGNMRGGMGMGGVGMRGNFAGGMNMMGAMGGMNGMGGMNNMMGMGGNRGGMMGGGRGGWNGGFQQGGGMPQQQQGGYGGGGYGQQPAKRMKPDQ